MAGNSGTVQSGATLITNAAVVGQNLTRSDVLRWVIGEINKSSAGLLPTPYPTTLPAVSADLSALQQEDAEVVLWTILFQLLIPLAGGGYGFSGVRTGAAAPNGSAYGNIGDLYYQSGAGNGHLWGKQAGNGTNTGWTQMV